MMKINTLSRGQAQEAMKNWIDEYPSLPQVDDEMSQLRDDIHSLHNIVRCELENCNNQKKGDYYLDVKFGLLLYDYFWKKKNFSMRVASNDGFWRYLSLIIVPDIVAQRWGKDNDSHFWSQPTRIWLRSIWWYVHLSWQGDLESTKKVIECDHFTTDTILNFEERSGRNGTHVEAYRQIIKLYSQVPIEVIKSKSRGKNKKGDDLFRIVMKLNTAKMLVMDPSLCLGGEKAYAQSLFKDAGVVLNVT